MWRINDETLTNLDYYEGFPSHYQKAVVLVENEVNKEDIVEATIYISPKNFPKYPEILPVNGKDYIEYEGR